MRIRLSSVFVGFFNLNFSDLRSHETRFMKKCQCLSSILYFNLGFMAHRTGPRFDSTYSECVYPVDNALHNQHPPISAHQSAPTNQLPPISFNQSAPANHHPPIIIHQSSPTNHRPPISAHQSSSTNQRPPIIAHRPPPPSSPPRRASAPARPPDNTSACSTRPPC